jgi:phosphoethanolamine N-methyltransferase
MSAKARAAALVATVRERLQRRRPAAAPAGASATAASATGLDRARFAELLWGEGFLWPGGEEHILDLAAPLHLRRGALVLDVAAGLGGPARALARRTGAWVTGLERAGELAARATARAASERLERRAAVIPVATGALELEKAAFDAVFARFATFDAAEKERLLRIIIGALRPGGRLLFVDFVDVDGAPGWAGFGATAASLWTRDQYADCLVGLGAPPLFVEDLSESYRTFLMIGTRRLLALLPQVDQGELARVADYAGEWRELAAALDAGGLGIVCFCAAAQRR